MVYKGSTPRREAGWICDPGPIPRSLWHLTAIAPEMAPFAYETSTGLCRPASFYASGCVGLPDTVDPHRAHAKEPFGLKAFAFSSRRGFYCKAARWRTPSAKTIPVLDTFVSDEKIIPPSKLQGTLVLPMFARLMRSFFNGVIQNFGCTILSTFV